MAHTFRRELGALLVIDLQERLAAAMPPERLARVVARTRAAIEGAKALGLPVVVTEQYPKGLGPTVKELAALLPAPIEKLTFSALVPEVLVALAPRTDILVVGMETHVCVFQTVRALTAAGLTPYLARDAVLSRDEQDFQAGLELCRDAGAVITSVEAALFDAMVRAGTPEFKLVSAAVK
jgi:nicotinamidase-related amidase